ncbi:hypothetical protein [Halorubrum sp. N11]|uniref:hypothetical protein n=1 Tax=Halorubrum sp. N11 TaxID=3402276 RepID=UPI003EB9E665
MDDIIEWVQRRRLTLSIIVFFLAWYGLQLSVSHLLGANTARWWFYLQKPPNIVSPGILFASISHDMSTLTHISSNILFLFVAGGIAEPYFDKKDIIYTVFFLGYLGTYLSNMTAFIHQFWIFAGASGGILAFWAYAGLKLRHKVGGYTSGVEISRESVEQIGVICLALLKSSRDYMFVL